MRSIEFSGTSRPPVTKYEPAGNAGSASTPSGSSSSTPFQQYGMTVLSAPKSST